MPLPSSLLPVRAGADHPTRDFAAICFKSPFGDLLRSPPYLTVEFDRPLAPAALSFFRVAGFLQRNERIPPNGWRHLSRPELAWFCSDWNVELKETFDKETFDEVRSTRSCLAGRRRSACHGPTLPQSLRRLPIRRLWTMQVVRLGGRRISHLHSWAPPGRAPFFCYLPLVPRGKLIGRHPPWSRSPRC